MTTDQKKITYKKIRDKKCQKKNIYIISLVYFKANEVDLKSFASIILFLYDYKEAKFMYF